MSINPNAAGIVVVHLAHHNGDVQEALKEAEVQRDLWVKTAGAECASATFWQAVADMLRELSTEADAR